MGGLTEDRFHRSPGSRTGDEEVSETIANDVQRSLDFFAATSATANIRKIFLAGGCAHVPALSRSIEEKTGVAVGILNPLNKWTCRAWTISKLF